MARMRITFVPEVEAPGPGGQAGSQAHWAGEDPVTRAWQQPSQRTSDERRRLALALLVSLLIHALLLSLTFGGNGMGLPGLSFPWRDRRTEVPPLRIVLVPAHVAKPSRRALIEPPVESRPPPTPPVSPAVRPRGRAVANVPTETPTAQAEAKRSAVARIAPAKGSDRAAPPRIVVPAAVHAQPSDAPRPVSRATITSPRSVVAVAPSASSAQTVTPASRDADDAAREVQRLEAARQEADRAEAVRLEAERQEAARQEAAAEAARLETERQEAARQAAAQLEAQRDEAARQEAARVEAARLEAERREAARQAAAQLEAQREEAARQEASRAEIARLEAEQQETARQAAAELKAQRDLAARQEAARVEASRLETERQEAARQEAARAEAARLEAERQEAARQAAAQLKAQRELAARQEAARAEAARLETERQEAARQAAAQLEAQRQEVARVKAEQEERREALLRAIGRQLDEEAAQRDAASTDARPPSPLPYSLSTARRVRLWGHTHPNAELLQYAQAWALKIQLNTPVETVRDVAKRPHVNPVVTVAIRSDGSVESVTFVVSSGVAEVDEAIRRIVESQRPYPAFSPDLAREVDVLEIRRTWHFDVAVRLY
ncbi:MAG TPA: TonB C-terminal domain-containing protein [Albitalea sp.]|uniref:TonB C-terminal domain-containing protein n=1 Tax=Piscinibacter sp. TaxID=1903157 RepID=UPI002ED50AB5